MRTRPHFLAALLLSTALGACSTTPRPSLPGAATPPPDERAGLPDGGVYKVGNPYQVEGIWYYPSEDYSYVEEGTASWYGPDFHGKRTANGERFDMNALTAAHPTLPMPSVVTVTNLDNGRQLKLRVNDRGPFKSKRIIDISRQGAQLLGFKEQGTARVRVEIDRMESLNIKNQYLARAPGEMPAITAVPRASVVATALEPPPPAANAQTASSSAASSPLKPPAAKPPTQAGRQPAKVANQAAPQLKPPVPGSQTAAVPPPQRSVPGKAKIDLPAGTGVYIQAGAFAESSNAHRLEQQLKEFGNVFIVTINSNGRQLYRVRLGPLQDDTAAEDLLKQVKSYGYEDAQIVRY